MTVADEQPPVPRWKLRHEPGCPATEYAAWAVEGTGLTIRQCRFCSMVELVLPPDTSTPRARYRAGVPQHRERRGAR